MRASIATTTALFLLGMALPAFPGGRLVVASREASTGCLIVVRAGAGACERYAAEELRAFVRRQTGVELRIVDDRAECPERAVLLGDTRHTRRLLGDAAPFCLAALGDEGFRLKIVGNRLLVVGGDGRGPLYGVYELLERFGGCAWYSPTFEVVPRLDAFEVPADLDETNRPAFALRSVNWNGHGRELAFAARNKLNLEEFGPELGGSRFRFDAVLGKCHTFNRLLPPEKWFAAHPEYFSEIGGVRRGARSQLCLTNPDVLRICTEKVMERIAESYPKGVRHYGVSQNDWLGYCECPRCAAADRKAKSHAGTLIAFVNAIAERVERTYPDVVVQTLAYAYTRHPPVGVLPRRNVQVCVCTIECDFFRSLADSRSIENRRVRRDFAGWAAAGAPLSVWDYATDFACYHHPWPNYDALRGNAAFFADHGVQEYFVLGNGGGANDLWANIRNWLLAKWMWNPRLETEPLLRRCFRDCFGPAATDVRAAFEELRRAPRDAKRFPMGCFESVYSEGIDDASLAHAAEWLERAAERAKGTPYEENVRLARLPVDFTRAIRGAARPVLSWSSAGSDRTRWESEREGARRVKALMESPAGLRFCDDAAGNAVFGARIRALAEQREPSRPVRRLALEECHLTGDYPCTRFRHVDDPLAADGRAVQLPGTEAGCIAWLDLRSLVLDADGLYLPRVRVRTNAAKGRVPFRAGVYSRRWDRSVAYFSPSADEPTDRYRWYSLGAVTPSRGDYLWIGLAEGEDGPAPDVWVDRVEFVQLD